jgi:hypothetical protein
MGLIGDIKKIVQIGGNNCLQKFDSFGNASSIRGDKSPKSDVSSQLFNEKDSDNGMNKLMFAAPFSHFSGVSGSSLNSFKSIQSKD